MYEPMCVCLFCAKIVPLEKTEEAFIQHEPNCEWVRHTRTNWVYWVRKALRSPNYGS